MFTELDFVVLQAKAMQDPEIQNILTDPVMRQVCLVTLLLIDYGLNLIPCLIVFFCWQLSYQGVD